MTVRPRSSWATYRDPPRHGPSIGPRGALSCVCGGFTADPDDSIREQKSALRAHRADDPEPLEPDRARARPRKVDP